MKKLGTGLGYLVMAVIAGIVAMVVLSIVALLFMFAGTDIGRIQNEGTMIAAFVIGAGLVITYGVVTANREATARKNQAEATALAQAASAAAEIDGVRSRVLLTMTSAVDAFGRMPRNLDLAAQWYARAVETYNDGAFSPFWSAIESAYASLADYRADAQRITASAGEHARLTAELARRGRLDPELRDFPVQLDVERVVAHHDAVAAKLDGIVYDAQKQPTFATIWEQRRTTAAVIAGFATLEQAVTRMRSELGSALTTMAAEIGETNRSVAGLGSSIASSAAAASAAQTQAIQDLTRRATEIRDALYYPDLTRWLR